MLPDLPLDPGAGDEQGAGRDGDHGSAGPRRLPSNFQPRAYALPQWSEEMIRRRQHHFEAAVLPSSRVLSFLGAGTYDHATDHCQRQRDHRLPSSSIREPGRRCELFDRYQSCARALTGFSDIHSVALTQHELWVKVLGWIMETRPGRSRILLGGDLAPATRYLIRTLAGPLGLVDVQVPAVEGQLNPAHLLGAVDEQTAVVLLASPNHLGSLEAVSEIGQIAHQRGALLGLQVDLLSLCALRPPGEFRANFCWADWGSLGVTPKGQGGENWLWAWAHRPGEIFQAAAAPECGAEGTLHLARNLEELDELTLQGRFERIWSQAHFLREALGQIPGCRLLGSQSFFREFVVQIPGPARELIGLLEDQGIFAGVALDGVGYPADWLLVSVSDQLDLSDLSYYLQAFRQALPSLTPFHPPGSAR